MEWLVEQPWCTGRIGMWGISWGGFSALQTAMLRPPMLQAICAMHATHDRFATDVHYIGGALHLFEQVDWPVGMAAQNLLPPDPAIVGDRWMAMWRERLEATPQWLLDWLEHQSRDDFWRHGSPCEDYGSITAATLLIGGWLDPYVDGMLELLAHLDAPRRAVIGPWGHYRPATGVPGPTLDHFDLLARWFGHWLADEDTGVMDDPLLTVFVRSGPPYDPVEGDAPGAWRAEPAWPLGDAEPRTLHLDAGRLTAAPPSSPATASWQGPWTVGTASPFWDLAGTGSTDTGEDDRRALTWETDPLPAPVEVLGRVEVTATVEVDRPGGRVVAHVVDVAPDGTSWFVTRGILDLAHRADAGAPTGEPVGEPFEVTVATVHTSAVFAAGHRIRVTLAGTDFPVVLPPPQPVQLTVHTGPRSTGRVLLPVVPPRRDDRTLAIPGAGPPPPPGTWVRDVARHRVERRATTTRVAKEVDTVEVQPGTGLTVATTSLTRREWSVAATADVTIDAGPEALDVVIALEARHDGTVVWGDRVERSIRRTWT
jgi:putative CocE/NonD family hydrolase